MTDFFAMLVLHAHLLLLKTVKVERKLHSLVFFLIRHVRARCSSEPEEQRSVFTRFIFRNGSDFGPFPYPSPSYLSYSTYF